MSLDFDIEIGEFTDQAIDWHVLDWIQDVSFMAVQPGHQQLKGHAIATELHLIARVLNGQNITRRIAGDYDKKVS